MHWLQSENSVSALMLIGCKKDMCGPEGDIGWKKDMCGPEGDKHN